MVDIFWAGLKMTLARLDNATDLEVACILFVPVRRPCVTQALTSGIFPPVLQAGMFAARMLLTAHTRATGNDTASLAAKVTKQQLWSSVVFFACYPGSCAKTNDACQRHHAASRHGLCCIVSMFWSHFVATPCVMLHERGLFPAPRLVQEARARVSERFVHTQLPYTLLCFTVGFQRSHQRHTLTTQATRQQHRGWTTAVCSPRSSGCLFCWCSPAGAHRRPTLF